MAIASSVPPLANDDDVLDVVTSSGFFNLMAVFRRFSSTELVSSGWRGSIKLSSALCNVSGKDGSSPLVDLARVLMPWSRLSLSISVA